MRRSYYEIVAEILHAATNGAKQTHIMNKCNLNYRQTKDLLGYLLEAGFLTEGNSFHTTEKGMKFVQSFRSLELLVKTKCERPKGQSSLIHHKPHNNYFSK